MQKDFEDDNDEEEEDDEVEVLEEEDEDDDDDPYLAAPMYISTSPRWMKYTLGIPISPQVNISSSGAIF